MSTIDPFIYYKLEIKLRTEMLGTCSQASIWDKHVIKQAQKMIKQANKLSGKVSKSLAKYKGDEIAASKEREELHGIVRRYQELLGKKDPIPEDTEELLEFIVDLEDELDKTQENKDQKAATCFMRDEDSWPIVSAHMILGNLKENARISTNNSTLAKEEKIFKSKVSVGECLALDVKPIESFMRPSNDIVRTEDGRPSLLERPIRFERMGKTETAISMSERLPEGTELSLHLRIRADSMLATDDAANIRLLLKLGKSNGLGQWRGSGSKGQFDYKLTKVDYDPAPPAEGWD